MERLFNELIGKMRTIKIARVDVVNAEPNDFAQDRERTVVVGRRSEYMRTSQLHGAVAHACKDQIIRPTEMSLRAVWSKSSAFLGLSCSSVSTIPASSAMPVGYAQARKIVFAEVA